MIERFAPDWLIISAGFDGHRDDPLAGLRLTAGDYADMARRLQGLVPAQRPITIRHLLSHSAGLASGTSGVTIADYEKLRDLRTPEKPLDDYVTALAKLPADRFGSGGEFAAALTAQDPPRPAHASASRSRAWRSSPSGLSGNPTFRRTVMCG